MDDNYLNYTSIDFAQDDAFIKWVKTGTNQEYWENWQEQHPEKADVLKEASLLVRTMKIQDPKPAPAQIDKIWSAIELATREERLEDIDKEAKIVRFPIGRAFAVAASLAVLVFFAWQFLFSTTEVVANRGQTVEYQLPDQSIVTLNADSRLSFSKRKWKKERIVELEGEAFFEVEKKLDGTPFEVQTSNGKIEVLGTSFNVNERDAQLKVECSTGRVLVNTRNSMDTLTKGLAVFFDGSKTTPYSINNTDIAIWRTGDFKFTNVAWQRIFEEIERQFAIRITMDESLALEKGSFFFNSKNDLGEVMKNLEVIFSNRNLVLEKTDSGFDVKLKE